MRTLFLILFISVFQFVNAQLTDDSWQIVAEDIDPNDYYGITCANGMVGLVSSPEPMRVKMWY